MTENWIYLNRPFMLLVTVMHSQGTGQAYDAMKTFLNENDMSLDENYAYASQIIDINSLAEYWIFEVFAGNFDWLINNIRFWKIRNSQSKGYGIDYGNSIFCTNLFKIKMQHTGKLIVQIKNLD